MCGEKPSFAALIAHIVRPFCGIDSRDVDYCCIRGYNSIRELRDAECALREVTPMSAIRIPAPTVADGLSAEEVRSWHEDQKILDADPRTAGTANRPAWLVRRVLEDARSQRLIAVRLVRNPHGRLVQWHLYDLGNGRGRIVYTSADGRRTMQHWMDRIAILRRATPCEGAEFVTDWVDAGSASEAA